MKKSDTISISIYDSIFILDEMVVEIVIIRIATCGSLSFSAKEIAELREVLRISIGDRTDRLTEEDLSEFGTSMLLATAVVLKTKYSNKKAPLET